MKRSFTFEIRPVTILLKSLETDADKERNKRGILMRTFENRKTKYIPVVFLIILFLAVAGILLAVFLYKK